MNLSEQQGQALDPKYIVEEQYQLINQLTQDNISLRAYIKQILADNQLMIEKLNEAMDKLDSTEDKTEKSE